MPTKDKVIFITFDDWGSDKTITRLLNVLDKHNATASFFARTNSVQDNPNLARAIADAGHDVVSHSHLHNPITSISVDELQKDSVLSHQILTQILGKAPHLFYRPPTLDYPNESLNALRAVGYNYVASGNPSTHDYERTAQQVADLVIETSKPGGLVVMHMSDNSCAADALEIFFPILQAEGYTFVKMSDYLQ